MTNTTGKDKLIIGRQLSKARELLQLPNERVASVLGVSPKDILDWEQERSQPSLKQLEKLADIYGRGIDYFLKETPIPPRDIELRGKPRQSFPDLPEEARTVLARFDELCRIALEVEGLLGKKRKVTLHRFNEAFSPQDVAEDIRRRLEVGNHPLANLRERLEREGIRIFELPVPNGTFSGFSFWHTEYGPCILLDANDPKGRRNFTLAHELAHLIYGHKSSLCYISLTLGDLSGDKELRANQVAVELLLPSHGIRDEFLRKAFTSTPSEKQLGQIATKWGVSIQALGYRLENLGLVKRGHTDTIVELRPKFLKRPRTPKWERQLGKQFVDTTIEAHERGLISAGRVAEGFGITVRKAMEEIDRRRGKSLN